MGPKNALRLLYRTVDRFGLGAGLKVWWVLTAPGSGIRAVRVPGFNHKVWLRAGTTPGDLRAAAPVIAAACGATVVKVEQHGRDDRVELHVVRPRWGWPAR